MKKIAVVYISLTGNTGAMADVVIASLKGRCELDVYDLGCDTFTSPDGYDAIAFGCPAMGQEVLEEDTFEPAFSAIEAGLKGKPVALFGSYGWGDGEWMRSWAQRCMDDGAVLVHDPVIAQEAPDDEACRALEALADSLLE